MKPIRTIFVGAGPEGMTTLQALVNDPEIEVTAVLTQPDKPVGRKQIMTPTPIKVLAKKLNLKIYSPNSENNVYDEILADEKPELIIVISFGEILPEEFINFPKYKCLNIHYSLLPLLRGAIPVQKAILDGHTKTGVTIQVMSKKLDEGPIIVQKEHVIEATDTTETLKDKLIFLGVDQLKKVLHPWIAGKIPPVHQDHSLATYCYKSEISKENAEIKWEEMEAEQIDRVVRAMMPWPVAWTKLEDGRRLKILTARLEKSPSVIEPGFMLKDENEVYIGTRTQGVALKLLTVQPEGKNSMSAEEFAQGLRV